MLSGLAFIIHTICRLVILLALVCASKYFTAVTRARDTGGGEAEDTEDFRW